MWTYPPSRILVPVDFGEASGRAVAVASALARRAGALVHLLHAEALEAPAYFTPEQLKALEREREVARSRADEFLADFARAQGVESFTTRITEGLPTSAILEAAVGVDLIVMGTHGRRGPARWWLGSVAERVIHQSPTPVLVVRAGSSLPPEEVFRRPMVLGGGGNDGLAHLARRVAQTFGGESVNAAEPACAADVATGRNASLIVLAGAGQHRTAPTHPTEQWLRSCALPMLFVPETASV